MDRRSFLMAGSGLAAAGLSAPALTTPALSQGTAARTLRFVPQANLANFDPIWGTQYVVRNAAAMVWDTLYGLVQEIPQKETTPFYPRSPYAVAKLYAYWITVNYREAYGMYACNGILFNHESPRRGETFVTRKITRGLANIAQGLEPCLYMGNMDALRDWGHAKDYVRMQWMMLQQEQPDDFVIATGVQYSVREFITWSAAELGVHLRFEGNGVDEQGIVERIDGDKAPALKVGDVIVRVDPRYFRPAEVETLLGDPTKAKTKLGWTPEITVQQMCAEMVSEDLKVAQRHALLKEHGHELPVSVEN